MSVGDRDLASALATLPLTCPHHNHHHHHLNNHDVLDAPVSPCLPVQAGELVPYTEFASSPLSGTANLNEEYFLWLQSGAYK